MRPAYARPKRHPAFDRRAFLRGAGALAVAAGAAVVAPLGFEPESTAAGASGELTPNQRAVHVALIEALAISPALEAVDAARAGDVTDELAVRYRAESGAARANIDAMLAAVEDPATPGAFAARPVPARLAALRAGLRAGGPASPKGPLPASHLVQGAVALAAAPFYPDWLRFDPAAVAV